MSIARGTDQGSGADGNVRPSADPVETLAGILGLPAPGNGTRRRPDWAAVEAVLGTALPGDYKRFAEEYGAGSVDGHVTVYGLPDAADAPAWADLVRYNGEAEESVRIDFGGPENASGDWHLGDASQWEPERGDVPSWFEPGDNLISWGSTENGDMLFWHVKPGVPADEWPVVFKEEGPYWERYGVGFSAALVGLLTGEIRSEYLSDWLSGPHSYTSLSDP